MISALLRLCEATEGSIEIDGTNIVNVPLPVLRSKISLIPQFPFLFATTIRGNLDPYVEYSDDLIWNVLDSQIEGGGSDDRDRDRDRDSGSSTKNRREGDKVKAKCTGWTKFYGGEITRVNSDGTYDIRRRS